MFFLILTSYFFVYATSPRGLLIVITWLEPSDGGQFVAQTSESPVIASTQRWQ
jgi:hypothetical protein